MDRTQAAPFRQQLLTQQSELLAQLAAQRGGVIGRAEVAAEHFGQPEDPRAQVATERELEFALGERETAHLAAVEAAMTPEDYVRVADEEAALERAAEATREAEQAQAQAAAAAAQSQRQAQSYTPSYTNTGTSSGRSYTNVGSAGASSGSTGGSSSGGSGWSGPTSRARSLVIRPDSTVCTQTSSRVRANSVTSGVPSSLPRCFRPPVQAKLDAIELVEVSLPFWCSR